MWRRASSAYICAGRHEPERHRERVAPPDRAPDRAARRARAHARAAEPAELALADRPVADDDVGRARAHGQRRVVHDPARRVAATRVQRDEAQVAQPERLGHFIGVAALAPVDAEPVDVGEREARVRHGALHRLARELELAARGAARLPILGLADAGDAGSISERPGIRVHGREPFSQRFARVTGLALESQR